MSFVWLDSYASARARTEAQRQTMSNDIDPSAGEKPRRETAGELKAHLLLAQNRNKMQCDGLWNLKGWRAANFCSLWFWLRYSPPIVVIVRASRNCATFSFRLPCLQIWKKTEKMHRVYTVFIIGHLSLAFIFDFIIKFIYIIYK